MDSPLPVIDLFAGPGGLGEGFASRLTPPTPAGRRAFRIALSIEKDPVAHRTLLLRAFYRQFPPNLAPAAYYDYLRSPSESARRQLFAACPRQSAHAEAEAWNATLGQTAEVDQRIEQALHGESDEVVLAAR